MSFHYEFMLVFDLKQDIPPEVIALLKYWTRTEDYPYDGPPPGPISIMRYENYFDPLPDPEADHQKRIAFEQENARFWRDMLQDRSALATGAGSAVATL